VKQNDDKNQSSDTPKWKGTLDDYGFSVERQVSQDSPKEKSAKSDSLFLADIPLSTDSKPDNRASSVEFIEDSLTVAHVVGNDVKASFKSVSFWENDGKIDF